MKRDLSVGAFAAGLYVAVVLILRAYNNESYAWVPLWLIGVGSFDALGAVTGRSSSWRLRIMYGLAFGSGLGAGLLYLPEVAGGTFRLASQLLHGVAGFFYALLLPIVVAVLITAYLAVLPSLNKAELRRIRNENDVWEVLATRCTPSSQPWSIWRWDVLRWMGPLAPLRLALINFSSFLSRPVGNMPGVVLFWFTMVLGVSVAVGGLLTPLIALSLAGLAKWGFWAMTMCSAVFVACLAVWGHELGRVAWRTVTNPRFLVSVVGATLASYSLQRFAFAWIPDEMAATWRYIAVGWGGSLALLAYTVLLLWTLIADSSQSQQPKSLPVGVEWASLLFPGIALLVIAENFGSVVGQHPYQVSAVIAVLLTGGGFLVAFAPRAAFNRRRSCVVWVGAAVLVGALVLADVASQHFDDFISIAQIALYCCAGWALLGSVSTFGRYLTAGQAVSVGELWRSWRWWSTASALIATAAGATCFLVFWRSGTLGKGPTAAWFACCIVIVPLLTVGASATVVTSTAATAEISRKHVEKGLT